MILDKHLIFMKGTDTADSETRAICLAQSDLVAPTDGMGPYEGLWLNVIAPEAVTGLEVTLEHSDTETGTFAALASYPAKTAAAGTVVLKAPVPFPCKNWLKLTFNKNAAVNAFLTAGVDKGGTITND